MVRRRWALALLAGGASAAALGAQQAAGLFSDDAEAPHNDPAQRSVPQENGEAGEPWWPENGHPPVDDEHRQIQGYASTTSVVPGDSIDFHVAMNPGGRFRVSVHRLGWYGGAGARTLLTGPELDATPQPVPLADPNDGAIICRWPVSWSLKVPADWPTGVYQAVFTSADGWRACTPFIVRDDRRPGTICVVMPVTTWQAYNQWPKDRRQGKSLYNGYTVDGLLNPGLRAARVSFDRPYAHEGFPSRFGEDQYAIQWLERSGYDISYATSLDLHAGRIDPRRHPAIVFCGHDEYWSTEMRRAAEGALAGGTSLAYFGANSIYWRILVGPSDGRPDRAISCTKVQPEPGQVTPDTTCRWRDLGQPEAAFLGVQYNGVVDGLPPLIVRGADHWFWAGTGVADQDRLPSLVGGEADGRRAGILLPPDVRATILSASPYRTSQGSPAVQNTHLYETPSGAVVFAAGTLRWARALGEPGRQDERIKRATANLFERFTRSPAAR